MAARTGVAPGRGCGAVGCSMTNWGKQVIRRLLTYRLELTGARANAHAGFGRHLLWPPVVSSMAALGWPETESHATP